MNNNKKPIIKVENLTKRFADFTAVDNISFKVKKGEIFAFLGPNGAGKSTTIKMLTTVLTPTKGKIVINDYDLQTDDFKIRQSFGIVFQDPSLDDELTAFENLELHAVLYGLTKKQQDKRIKELLTLVDLTDKKDKLVKTFSGGMKRRLEIARGLLHHPKIFFLDEPTIGLDPQTRKQMWKYLKKLNDNYDITIFFTTHYMQEAEEIADYINIIDHGKIVAHGTTSDLIKQAKAKTLEEAYLQLTGYDIREEQASNMDHLRSMHHKFRRRKR